MTTRIDWLALFAEHRITYIERGANVRRGEANIQCPFCGSADPSQHLGINLESGWWSCWRNREQHSGKSPVRLLMRLLGINHGAALALAGLDASWVDPDGFGAMAARLRNPERPSEGEAPPERQLDLDPEFYDLTNSRAATRHWNYLEDRYFEPERLQAYNVMCGVRGAWTNRIILPYYEDGRLVTWTGRAVGHAEIRYKDLPRDEKRPGEAWAIVPAKDTLYNHDAMLPGGKWLILVEGPFDALKLDLYGQAFGVRAVALSTASISERQLSCLGAYGGRFDHLGVMMDNATQLDVVDSMRMKGKLAELKLPTTILQVPKRKKDPGELTPSEVRGFCRQLTMH